MRPSLGGRGQSAVVGNLLLVAVGIVLVALLAVVGFGLVDSAETRAAPTADVRATLDGPDLTVEHVAGDVFRTADLEVVLRTPGATLRLPLENFREAPGDRFGAGDTARLAHGVADGTVTVRVVHEPSNAVVERARKRVTGATVALAAFDDTTGTNDYAGGQSGQGSTTVADGGRTVRLEGNQWKYLDYDYNVTPETVLTFEFKSTAEGDIHGIGLEDDTGSQDQQRVVRLYGTQPWGINVSTAGQPYYRAGDGWRRYTVPLGELYEARGRLGGADHLVVVMDCDPDGPSPPRDGCKSQTEDGEPTATAAFRNVEIREADG
jgi:hypothetical protein